VYVPSLLESAEGFPSEPRVKVFELNLDRDAFHLCANRVQQMSLEAVLLLRRCV